MWEEITFPFPNLFCFAYLLIYEILPLVSHRVIKIGHVLCNLKHIIVAICIASTLEIPEYLGTSRCPLWMISSGYLRRISKWVIPPPPPSAAYMRHWIGSALVQVMDCRLFGAIPLHEPMLAGDRRIPLTKGQWHGERFYLMTWMLCTVDYCTYTVLWRCRLNMTRYSSLGLMCDMYICCQCWRHHHCPRAFPEGVKLSFLLRWSLRSCCHS